MIREQNYKENMSKTEFERYATILWKSYNTKYFSGKLKFSGIEIQKNTKAVRRLGGYYLMSNVITLHPRLVNAGKEAIVETLLHEMCHQAVNLIDRKSNPGSYIEPHGVEWKRWMVKCGLKPMATSNMDSMLLKTQAERDKINAIKNIRTAEGAPKKLTYLKTKDIVQYVDSRTNRWTVGMFIGRPSRSGNKVYIYLPDKRVMIVSSNQLHEVPTTDISKHITGSLDKMYWDGVNRVHELGRRII